MLNLVEIMRQRVLNPLIGSSTLMLMVFILALAVKYFFGV